MAQQPVPVYDFLSGKKRNTTISNKQRRRCATYQDRSKAYLLDELPISPEGATHFIIKKYGTYMYVSGFQPWDWCCIGAHRPFHMAQQPVLVYDCLSGKKRNTTISNKQRRRCATYQDRSKAYLLDELPISPEGATHFIIKKYGTYMYVSGFQPCDWCCIDSHRPFRMAQQPVLVCDCLSGKGTTNITFITH